jgi:hypothetical protein
MKLLLGLVHTNLHMDIGLVLGHLEWPAHDCMRQLATSEPNHDLSGEMNQTQQKEEQISLHVSIQEA